MGVKVGLFCYATARRSKAEISRILEITFCQSLYFLYLRQLGRGAMLSVASISDEVREELKALRSRESTDSMAIVLKIDPDTLTVVMDETYEDITLDELQEEGGQPEWQTC